ncbi:recombinase family protein [Amycolatopsis sp.]|uniref:recombinase family protein n=1 Tax=Amycolatopsis sp. TaxID=37632 RepID=UPI002E06E997|nr:recombinase family protein [Amycolatopsis sp.]
MLDSYARLSRNPSGKLEKVETQHADNHEVISRLGGVLGEDIDDPKLSAWNPKVHRPGWDRVLKRIAARACDGLVIWNTDRAVRLSSDLEDLFKLIDDSFLLGSSHGRYDLSDYNDRYQLRMEVAHNQRSSDESSQRIKRRFDVLRRNGVPHQQGRVFGFAGLDRTVARGTEDREAVPAVLVERERAALRAATSAVLAGTTLVGLTAEWNKSGLLTVTGKAWTPSAVRAVLLRPRNAGLVEHDGDIVGRMAGDPVVDPEEFERLRALFAGRTSGRAAGERYLASGIVVCGLCGKGLSGRPHVGEYPDGARRRQYGCTKSRGGCGHVAADARLVDRELRGLVLARLTDKKQASAIKAARALISDRLAAVQTKIDASEARQEAIAAKWGADKMSEKAFDKANEPLIAELTKLYAKRDELTGGNPEGPTEAMSREEAEEKWKRADNGERRAMLRDALGRDRIFLDPADKAGFRKFTAKRVRVDPYRVS